MVLWEKPIIYQVYMNKLYKVYIVFYRNHASSNSDSGASCLHVENSTAGNRILIPALL